MIYYHYTSEPHLELIQESGIIKTTDSNVSGTEEHVGPDVVWLFKEPLRGTTPRMLITHVDLKFATLYLDKSKMEIQVDIPAHEVRRADKFFKKLDADPKWISHLESSGQSKNKKWYVIERDIPKSEWVDITVRPEASDVLKEHNTGKVQRIGHVEGTYVVSNQ